MTQAVAGIAATKSASSCDRTVISTAEPELGGVLRPPWQYATRAGSLLRPAWWTIGTSDACLPPAGSVFHDEKPRRSSLRRRSRIPPPLPGCSSAERDGRSRWMLPHPSGLPRRRSTQSASSRPLSAARPSRPLSASSAPLRASPSVRSHRRCFGPSRGPRWLESGVPERDATSRGRARRRRTKP